MSPTEQTTVALETLRYLRSSPLMANHHAGLDAAIAALTAPAAEVPEALTDTDVARIFRRVYGGNRFDATERMFAAEIAAARDAQWQSTRLSGGVPEVATGKGFFVGAQNDQWFIVFGDNPAQSNDYPNHEADRTPVAKVYDEALARTLCEYANAAMLTAAPQAPAAEVNAEPATVAQLRKDFARECGDTDILLRMLGFQADEVRTDGGSLNLSRLASLIEQTKSQGGK